MEAWETIILALSGNLVALAVLGHLARSLLAQLLLRDAKRFEADLQAKADIAIEHLRNELQLRTLEHQIRFSRLHERRADVIAELYGYIVEALWEAESFLSPMEWAGEPNKKEKHRVAMKTLVDLYRYFDKRRIYLPPDVCAKVETMVKDVRTQVINFGVWVRYEDVELPDSSHREKQKAWDSGWDAIKTKIPAAREALEIEFRQLLGDTFPAGLMAATHQEALRRNR